MIWLEKVRCLSKIKQRFNQSTFIDRVGCSERRVVYFRKLLFKSDKKKLSFRRVESEGLQLSRKRSVVEHFASK